MREDLKVDTPSVLMNRPIVPLVRLWFFMCAQLSAVNSKTITCTCIHILYVDTHDCICKRVLLQQTVTATCTSMYLK